MSHNVEKWRKLLSDFQDAYAQHGRAFFYLYAVTFNERGLSRPPGKPWAQLGRVFGCLPLDSEGENGYTIIVIGPEEGSSPDVEERRNLIVQGVPIAAAHEAALESFLQLAAMAGASLPSEVRDSIPAAPDGALSWWLATMLWSNPPLQIELQKKIGERQGYRLVWFDPFRESIETIERCNLVSETPSLRSDLMACDKPNLNIDETRNFKNLDNAPSAVVNQDHNDGSREDRHNFENETAYSPWIITPELIPIMQTNNIKAANRRGYSDRSITRIKNRWKAESQAGSNNRRFRFKLATLNEQGINYPKEWDKEKT